MQEELDQIAFLASEEGFRAIRDSSTNLTAFLDGSAPGDLAANLARRSRTAIVDCINSHRRHDGWQVKGAEESLGTSGVRWIVNPLCGTVDSARLMPYHAVSVAAEVEGETVAAHIVQMSGATLVDRIACGPAGLMPQFWEGWVIPAEWEPARAVLGFALPDDAECRRDALHLLADIAPHVGAVRCFGSAAYDLANVVQGGLDGFVGFGQRPWDVAAGLAVVRAAGGTARWLRGESGLEVVIAGTAAMVDAVSCWASTSQ
ncbi:inositol monophosphatase family protein [Streptomyces sp. NPDC002766]|uniref:inositol monophosphatase family protein n=1 Tax=Streptomyces sp. NPDC002766 TaxID=3154429 RepID=UPI00332F3EDC